MSYFWGHLSNKIEKRQAATGAVTYNDPESFLVWNRVQPEDTTQKKCQRIIIMERVTLPQGSLGTAAPQQVWKRLPTLELQQVWPRNKVVPAQPGPLSSLW